MTLNLGRVHMLESRAAIQRDLNEEAERGDSTSEVRKFREGKCEATHLGWGSPCSVWGQMAWEHLSRKGAGEVESNLNISHRGSLH